MAAGGIWRWTMARMMSRLSLNMKKLLLSLPILCLAALTACSALTSAPPTKVESALFDIKTNYVPVVAVQTNVVTVTQTNMVTVRNPVTEVMYQTNQVSVVSVGTNTVTVTNLVPAYDFTVKTNVSNDVSAIGAVASTFFPGFGGLISTGIAGLLGLWATMRTKSQGNQIAANLTQAIQTARSVIKSLPNGAAIGAQFDNFLVQHQTDANLLDEIGAIVDSTVNNDQAQGAATKIINLITTPLNTPPAPTVAAAAPSNG